MHIFGLKPNLLKLKPMLSPHPTRETGKRHPIKYQTSPFFYLHTINAYEEDGHLVVDICCYARYILKLFVFQSLFFCSPAMMNCMYLEELSKAQTNPQYAK